MNNRKKKTPAPRVLTAAEIPEAIAFLEQQGYRVYPPPEEAPPPPVPDMDATVKEAEEKLEYLRRLENDADERCMGTPLNDRYLEQYRAEAINLGHRVANAEEDLRKAIEDRKLING